MTPIALMTDFGTRDHFVAAMKGVILSINADALIVDITHEVPPQDVRAAAFLLAACYEEFPVGTIFVAVVDPGVGSDRRAILAESSGYRFIAPDNGLLSLIGAGPLSVRELTVEKYFRHPVSRTFHGRDIFSPVAAHLSNGVDPERFGPEIGDIVRLEAALPVRTGEGIDGAVVLHVDHFGNLITNLRRDDLPDEFELSVGGRRIGRLREYFAGADAGEVFLICGSAGFLEIVANRDSAARLLGAKAGQKISVIC